MQFLTYSQCAQWCAEHGYPTNQKPGYIVGPDADLESSSEFHFVEFTPPTDSGKKVWFAKFLCGLLQPSSETLIWLGDWNVWPSSEHMPLFHRVREALGERRPLIQAPGHLVTADDADDALSIFCIALLFIWNCHILSGSGQEAIFTSHDEYGWFASRDPLVAEAVRKKLETILAKPAP